MKNDNIHDKTALTKYIKYKTSKQSIEYEIHQKLYKKYVDMPKLYNLNIIDNIIYNDKTHIVSLFKDHLISDDKGDFLKRYYNKQEIDLRLPKFYEFYELYSKIFPNYTCIEEGKYFYRNIQHKQKMINMIEKLEMEKKLKNNNFFDNNNITDNSDRSDQKVFSTNVIDSLLNVTNDEGMNILFNINKNKIKEEENNFINEINVLINEIDKCKHNSKSKNNKSNINNLLNLIKNKNNNKFITKINNRNNDNNSNNQKKEIKLNSIVKFFSTLNKSKNKNKNGTNDFLNAHNNNYTKINLHHKHINKNFNYSKNAMTDRILIEKLEQNYFKLRKNNMQNHKNISQNMSTSMKTKKDISSSKKNLSICSKKPNSISTSYNNGLLNNFNQRFTTYLITSKGSPNEIKNIKKEIPIHNSIKSYLSSRNNVLNFSSYINNNKNKNKNKKNNYSNSNSNKHKNNAIKSNCTVNNNYNNICSRNVNINLNIKKITTIKRNFNDSRNKQFGKNFFKYSKRSSNKLGNILNYTNSIISYNNDSKNNLQSKNNSKSKIINYPNSLFDLNNLAHNQENHYKNIESKKKIIRETILYNGFKICNSSRNKKYNLSKKTSYKNLTNSKRKNISNKNDSLIKIGFKGNINELKKNKVKGIKINNFSKIFNAFINRCNNNTNRKINTDRNKIKININK